MNWNQSAYASYPDRPDDHEQCVNPTLEYLRWYLGDVAFARLCEHLFLDFLIRDVRASLACSPYSPFVAAPPNYPTHRTTIPIYPQDSYQTFSHATSPDPAMTDLLASMENVSLAPSMEYNDKTLLPTTDDLFPAYSMGDRAPPTDDGHWAPPAATSTGSFDLYSDTAIGATGVRGVAPPTTDAAAPQYIPAPLPVSPSSARTSPSTVVVERLQQDTYTRNQVFKGVPAGPVIFNEGRGVLLNDLDLLHDGGRLAFAPKSSIGEKASLRFRLPGFKEYPPQVRVRHGGRCGRPCTLQEMAEIVRGELLKLLKRPENASRALEHRGAVVSFERIVLLRIEHVSQGSIQPILGIGGDGGGS